MNIVIEGLLSLTASCKIRQLAQKKQLLKKIEVIADEKAVIFVIFCISLS